MHSNLRSTSFFVLAILLVVQLGCQAAQDCVNSDNFSQELVLECVTVEGVRAHLQALQSAAEANGGNRAAGTPGYEASLAYVVAQLQAAGYEPQLQRFEFSFQPLISLEQSAPNTAQYETGFVIGSGSGAVSGPVVPISLALGQETWPGDPSTSSSGCEDSDFDNVDFSGANDIALIMEGACLFSKKALNAEKAGAEAVIFLIKDTTNFQMGLPVGKADLLMDGRPSNVTIPLIGTALANGAALAQPGSEAVVDVPAKQIVDQFNVLADLQGQEAGEVVMAGAHLDSVQQGPGISDNGTGSAALLETAVQMSKLKPYSTVRFAWWAAEESGQTGSTAYVNGLTQKDLQAIRFYLNFDMIGSPNYVNYIYDGDNSDGVGSTAPQGSAKIEQLFETYYSQLGLPFTGTDFDGKTDYQPFLAQGVPVGGLFSGAGNLKRANEAEIFGGNSGEAYDPCYHNACDNLDNINFEALAVNADAVAYAILQLAMNDE